MELTISRGDLLRAARVAHGVVRRAPGSIPVLSNVLLDFGEAEEGVWRVAFVGTDLESVVRVSVPAQVVGGPGRLTVPADKLAEIAGVLEGGDVHVRPDGGHVRIGCGVDEYDLVSLPADDYPVWVGEPCGVSVELPVGELAGVLDATLYALPTMDHRRVLMGLLVELGGMGIRATGTDGKQMSRVRRDASVVGEGRGVVPGRFLGEVRKALGDEGVVRLEMGERQVCIVVGDVEFRSNLIVGKYPDIDAVVPREFRWEVRVNRPAMIVAARRAGVTADSKIRTVVLSFVGGGVCRFSSMAEDVGAFQGAVDVAFEGDGFEVAFNVQLFVETLGSFVGDELVFCVADPVKPCVVRCDADPDRLCVLMPVRLADVGRVKGEG